MIRWMIAKQSLAVLLAAGAPATLHPTWELGAGTVTATSVQAARSIPIGTKWVVADVERWDFTPVYQQKHPVWAIQHICHLAHARGARCIAAPAADLFGGETGYLRFDVARAARWADVFEIQSQSAELNLTNWRHWIYKARHQAKAANPNVTVMAGLTTSDRVGHVTGRALLRAVRSAEYLRVHAFWLNVPGAGPMCPTCGAINPYPAVWMLKELYP